MTGHETDNIERALGRLENGARNIEQMLSENSQKLMCLERRVVDVEILIRQAKGSWRILLALATFVSVLIPAVVWVFRNFTFK